MSPEAIACATAYFSQRSPPPHASCPPPFHKAFALPYPLNCFEQGGAEVRRMGQQRRPRAARCRRLLSCTALLLRARVLPPQAHQAEWDESVDALHTALAFVPPPNYRCAPLRSGALPVEIEPRCGIVPHAWRARAGARGSGGSMVTRDSVAVMPLSAAAAWPVNACSRAQ